MDHPMSEEAEMAMPINSTYVHSHPRLIQHHHHHHHHDQQSPQPFNHIIPSSNGTNTNTTMEAAEAPDQIAVIGNNSEPFPTKKIKQSQQQQQKQQQQQVVVVKYRECLKNHAAAMGGNATDGCGEFMPSGEEGTVEALTCSACNCHRNFHRKEIEGGDHNQMMMMIPSPSSCDCYHRLVNNRGSLTGLGGGGGHGRNLIALPGHHHHNHHSSSSKAIIAAATGAAAEPCGYAAGGHAGGGALVPAARSVPIMPFSSMAYMPSESDEQEGGVGGCGCGGSMGRVQTHQHHQNMVIKKRFRTKFTQEQKEKMFNFAEKVGWKIQKQEESVVQHFCEEIGVRRRVLKVWMHNNKHNLAKKLLHNSPSTA